MSYLCLYTAVECTRAVPWHTWVRPVTITKDIVPVLVPAIVAIAAIVIAVAMIVVCSKGTWPWSTLDATLATLEISKGHCRSRPR